MKDQDHYQFTAKARYSSGTNIARCNGKTASSTNSLRIAAESAAQKAFEAMCATLNMDPKPYLRGSCPLPGDVFEVNFTRLP